MALQMSRLKRAFNAPTNVGVKIPVTGFLQTGAGSTKSVDDKRMILKSIENIKVKSISRTIVSLDLWRMIRTMVRPKKTQEMILVAILNPLMFTLGVIL